MCSVLEVSLLSWVKLWQRRTHARRKKKKLKLLLRSGKNDLRIISAASRDGFYVTFIFVFVHRMRDELAALSKNASLCVSRQQLWCVYAVEKQSVAPSTGGVWEQQENSEKALTRHFIRYTLLLSVFMDLWDLDVVTVEAIYAQWSHFHVHETSLRHGVFSFVLIKGWARLATIR